MEKIKLCYKCKYGIDSYPDCIIGEPQAIIEDNTGQDFVIGSWCQHFQMLTYSEYLQTKHWKSLRSVALKRFDYQCARCGSAKNLQVHHVNYENMGLPGSELEDLIVLCNKCHEEVHKHDLLSRQGG